MADNNDPEGINRTFAGDPNAPAKAPEVKVTPAPTSDSPMEQDTPVDGNAPGTAPSSVKHPKPRLSVVDNGDGTRDVYAGTQRLGVVNVPGADKVLEALGNFNPEMKSWDDVPEDVAKKLMSGRLPLVPYLEAKWAMGEAATVRGMVGRKWLKGEMTTGDAMTQGDVHLIGLQLNDQPVFAYQGNFGDTVAQMWKDLQAAGPLGVGRRTAGEIASTLPDLIDMTKAGAKGAVAAGGTAALVVGGLAATGLTEGAAAPAAIAAAKTWAARGEAAGIFKHAFDTASGHAALDMLDKGIDEETARKLAPIAGALNGALMVGQVKFMTAGLRRTFLKEVLASQTVKGVMARYIAEAGAGTSLAAAQKAVDIAVNDLAAQQDERPDLMTKTPVQDVVNAVLSAGPVMAVLGLPGASMEAAKVRLAKTVQNAKPGEPAAAAAAAPAPEPAKGAEPIKPVEGAAAAAPAAEPAAPRAETIDTTGDYLPPSTEKLQKKLAEVDAGKATPADLEAVVNEMSAAPKGLGEKTLEAERKGHIAALKDELSVNEEQAKLLEQQKARFEREGRATAVIDRKLEKLNVENADLRGNIEFYDRSVASRVGFEGNEKLLLSPANLESAVNMGFKEGRKEVLDVRRKQILNVAERLDLTPTELREAMGQRNYGVMSDAEFDHWFNGGERKKGKDMVAFEGFVDKAKAVLRERYARDEVQRVLKDKAILGERNIRALHDLPPIGRMNEQQLYKFLDVLDSYEKGSRALPKKNIEALQTGPYKEARTYQDVQRLAAEKLKKPLDSLLGARRDQFDYLRGDVALAEKHPLFAAVVDPVQQARARAAATHEAWHETNVRLGAEALASRSGILKRFIDPTMPEVVKHLEVDPALLYAGQVDPASLPKLTPAEQWYVDFLRESFHDAREYLRATGELEQSRFENSYFPHVKRSLLEVVKSIKDSGVRKALGEMVDGMFNSQEKLTVPDPQAFGYRKFFKNTVFRTGELKPSQEVMRVADNYMRDFIEKRELDIAGPEALTLARSVLALETDKSPDMVKAREAVLQLVKDYLNNKKGINTTFEKIAPRGGAIDATLRATSAFISATRIALNAALEVTAPIGENLAATQVTGHGGYAKAQLLMLTPEGRKFLENYEHFTGKGQFETFFEPGRNAEQRAATLMYGALQMGRTHALKSILLALATPEEIKAGKMAPERLAEIERQTGRWVDLHGMKSIAGSTTPGAAYTKFRTWMLPIMRSVTQDLKASIDSLRGQKEMTSQQKWELVSAAINTSVAASALYLAKPDPEDKSMWADVRRRATSELFSILQGANPTELLKPGPVVKFYEDLYNNLKLLYTMERYKGGDHEGELKGPPALERQLVPVMFRQFKKPEEK